MVDWKQLPLRVLGAVFGSDTQLAVARHPLKHTSQGLLDLCATRRLQAGAMGEVDFLPPRAMPLSTHFGPTAAHK